jgi:hypothetical protein
VSGLDERTATAVYRVGFLLLVCTAAVYAQTGVALNWKPRIAGTKLYRLNTTPSPLKWLLARPQPYEPAVVWAGVEDHEDSEHYSRMGGPNIPRRLAHVIIASILMIPGNTVVSVQAQPFRPVDRIAIRPDQLYIRYRKPWQPGVASLRNSGRRNLATEFGPDLKNMLRLRSNR